MRLYSLFHTIAKHATDSADKTAKYKVVRCIIDAIRDGYLEITDDVQSIYEELDLVEAYIASPERQLEEPERHLQEILLLTDPETEEEEDDESVPEAPPVARSNLMDTLHHTLTALNSISLGIIILKLIA